VHSHREQAAVTHHPEEAKCQCGIDTHGLLHLSGRPADGWAHTDKRATDSGLFIRTTNSDDYPGWAAHAWGGMWPWRRQRCQFDIIRPLHPRLTSIGLVRSMSFSMRFLKRGKLPRGCVCG
jgi:hypothetical protein